LLERLADWLAELAVVEVVNNLAVAEALIRRRGLPAVLLANPQAQGPADDFCTRLQDMLAAQRVILISDSLNASFAARYGMGWLSATVTPRQQIIGSVSALLADKSIGLRDGAI